MINKKKIDLILMLTLKIVLQFSDKNSRDLSISTLVNKRSSVSIITLTLYYLFTRSLKRKKVNESKNSIVKSNALQIFPSIRKYSVCNKHQIAISHSCNHRNQYKQSRKLYQENSFILSPLNTWCNSNNVHTRQYNRMTMEVKSSAPR